MDAMNHYARSYSGASWGSVIDVCVSQIGVQKRRVVYQRGSAFRYHVINCFDVITAPLNPSPAIQYPACNTPPSGSDVIKPLYWILYLVMVTIITTDSCRSNALDSCLGGTPFESRSVHGLFASSLHSKCLDDTSIWLLLDPSWFFLVHCS
jgi:hypothetical protein